MISKKLVLIGDFSTGKTSLIRRFVDNQFSDKYLSTIGVKISKKIIKIDNTHNMQALIWDIEGGTDTKPINTTYLRGTHGCIIVADVTREETQNNISLYIETINKIIGNVPIVIALNKSDKLDISNNQNILEKIQNIYIDYDIFLTSAKNSLKVNDIFLTLSNKILKT